jgi:hypothetical protein
MESLELFGDGMDGGRAMAWMLFPADAALREHHMAREVAEQACKEAAASETISIAPQTLLALLDGPGGLEMKRLAAEATKRGTVAGDLLHLLYEMHARGVDEPSFGKALEHYKRFAPGLTYGDGEALKYSEQTLRTYFDEFRSVAHLWAAWRLNTGPYAYLPDPRQVFHDASSLQTFLGVAKGVADFATTFIPKRTKPPRPVIEINDLIAIPESIASIRLTFHTTRP